MDDFEVIPYIQSHRKDGLSLSLCLCLSLSLSLSITYSLPPFIHPSLHCSMALFFPSGEQLTPCFRASLRSINKTLVKSVADDGTD